MFPHALVPVERNDSSMPAPERHRHLAQHREVFVQADERRDRQLSPARSCLGRVVEQRVFVRVGRGVGGGKVSRVATLERVDEKRLTGRVRVPFRRLGPSQPSRADLIPRHEVQRVLFSETLDGPIGRDDNVPVGEPDDEHPLADRVGREGQALQDCICIGVCSRVQRGQRTFRRRTSQASERGQGDSRRTSIMYMSDGTCKSTRSACRNEGGARTIKLTGIESADPAGRTANMAAFRAGRAVGAETATGAGLGRLGVLTRMREGRRVIVACFAALSSTRDAQHQHSPGSDDH